MPKAHRARSALTGPAAWDQLQSLRSAAIVLPRADEPRIGSWTGRTRSPELAGGRGASAAWAQRGSDRSQDAFGRLRRQLPGPLSGEDRGR